ncbi:MAG: fluoride efflux transporter CrcB [Sandarakinorhabdus sp.]|nr:fluoride efflux transporter CrcB [Sandarakinorhabdus sp.]
MPVLSSVPPLILVAIGGAFGACMRYLVGRWALLTLGAGLPFGTWAVNISGAFAMGLLTGWLTRGEAGSEDLRLLIGVGVLGGFTTFSAFSLEVFTMINRNEIGLAAAYAVSSVAGSVLALMTGVWLARA